MDPKDSIIMRLTYKRTFMIKLVPKPIFGEVNFSENLLFSWPVQKYRKSYYSYPSVGVGIRVAQMFKLL